MKWILADSSGPRVWIAAAEDEGREASLNLDLGKGHSQSFFAALAQILEWMNWTLEEVDAYACVVGPGSFTGLRIAVTALKTLAYVQKKPVYPLQKLEILSWQTLRNFQISGISKPLLYNAPALDARNRRVYAGLYGIVPWTNMGEGKAKDELNFQEILPVQALDLKDWVEQLLAVPPFGAGVCQELLYLQGAVYSSLDSEEQVRLQARFPFLLQGGDVALNAQDVLRYLCSNQGKKLEGDPQKLLPNYILASQAERARESKR